MRKVPYLQKRQAIEKSNAYRRYDYFIPLLRLLITQRHILPHPKALPRSPKGTSSPARSVRTTRLLRADEAGCAFGCAHSGSTIPGVSNAGALLPPLFKMIFTTPTASVMTGTWYLSYSVLLLHKCTKRTVPFSMLQTK